LQHLLLKKDFDNGGEDTMERPFFKISISKFWIISNCLIMVIFFSLNSFFSQRSYQKVLEEQMEVKQYQMLVYISDTLEQSMKSIELLARSTVNNYSIINNILNYRKDKNSYEQMVFQNNMNQNLSSVAYSLGDIISVNILLEDDDIKTTKINGVYDYNHYAKGQGLAGIHEISDGWLPTRKNDLWFLPYVPFIVTYVQRIHSGMYYGEGIGHLVVNLNEEMFYNQIKSYQQDENSTILLVDGSGIVISGTDRSIIGEQLQDTPYGEYGEAAIQKMQVATIDHHRIISSRKLEGRNLYVLAISDYDKAMAPLRQTQQVVLISSLALLVLFSVISGTLAYKISQPILRLSKEVMNFKGDQWNQRIEISSRIYEIDVLCTRFNRMTAEIETLIKSLLEQEKLKQKKELEILQAQINPHFLYNTLEAINWMALSMKQKEISNMVILLGNFLRLSLNKGKNIYAVRDELNHLKCYLDIQNIRCRGKILFSTDIDESVLGYRMIKLLLQPLVENSILHGFDFRGGTGQIWVKVCAEDEYIYFSVVDDGCGMSEELIQGIIDMESDIGHGIKNVMKRISLYYGDDCGLTIHSKVQVGTTIEIKILNEVPGQQI